MSRFAGSKLFAPEKKKKGFGFISNRQWRGKKARNVRRGFFGVVLLDDLLYGSLCYQCSAN